VDAGRTATSFNTATSSEKVPTIKGHAGIRKVVSNVIAFRSASTPIEVESLAQSLVTSLLSAEPEGGTYDPRSNSFPTFTDDDLYIVSVPRHEFRLRGAPTAGGLIGWLSRVRALLAVEQSYLGWWRDGDDLVFDVSIPVRGDREVIFAIAYAWGQDAVYHPASSTVLRVPELSARAA
jgi:hypothetical protein